ncbi:MAG: hypothetical protein JWO15_988 [Sphingomonadales bacterium]|nr:hypothetical protein [Sphingomonadales bacterium]
MVSILVNISASNRHLRPSDDLLRRETNHRCSNDLQMVVSMLELQSRHATTPEALHVLTDAMERVAIVARARGASHQDRQPSLVGALRQVCEALHAYAEPRGILLSMHVEDEAHSLSTHQTTTLALVVNELATNAIKHAFEKGKTGHIRITTRQSARHGVTIVVDDDGLPFPELTGRDNDGFGLQLVKKLMASIGGLFILPPKGTKAFKLRVPLTDS